MRDRLDPAQTWFTHVSEQLDGVFNTTVILRVGVDEHSRGFQPGCVGHLGGGNQREQEAAAGKEGSRDGPARTFSAKLFLPALSSSTLPVRFRFCSIMKSLSSP